jgi:hypothetical protein
MIFPKLKEDPRSVCRHIIFGDFINQLTICLHPWSIRFSKLLWVLLTEVRITKHHESTMVLWIPDVGKVVVGPCKHVIYDRCPGTCLLDNTTLTLSFWWSLCAADSLGSSCTDDLAIEGWKKLLSCLWSVQLQMTAPVHLLKGATSQYCQECTVIIQSTGLHWGRNPWYPWLFLVRLLQRKKCRWDRSHIKSTYKNKDLHTEQKSGEWL